MFTGIVEERGEVLQGEGGRLSVSSSTVAEGSDVGASVAVNGVCLTVARRGDATLTFDLSRETLERSVLGELEPGDGVNLERPVTLASRLGGHLVQGHVDGVGTVTGVAPDLAGGAVVRISMPTELMRFVVEKGSIAVDGVSLTVAALHGDGAEVALIPHTLGVTTLGTIRPGDRVNLEVDVVAKYVDRLIEGSHR